MKKHIVKIKPLKNAATTLIKATGLACRPSGDQPLVTPVVVSQLTSK